MHSLLRPMRRRAACHGVAMVGLLMMTASPTLAGEKADRPLTVGRPKPGPAGPVVPSPALPGAPIPWSGSPVLTPLTLSIVDGQTRFLTEGVAQEHCPGDRVLFFSGVVDPFRPTLPGDGAFICRRDAIAEGFAGP